MQKRLIVRVALLPTLALALIGGVLTIETSALLREAAALDVELASVRPLLLTVLGFIVVVAAILVHQAFSLSHRIGGPAYRLIATLRDLREGKPPRRVQLRRGDFLTEIADEYNQLVDTWSTADAAAGASDPAAVPCPVDETPVATGR